MIVLKDLIPLLIERTRQGKLLWMPASYGYKVGIGGNWITLEGDATAGRVTFFNKEGSAVDRLDYTTGNDSQQAALLFALAQEQSFAMNDPSLQQVEQLLKAM